MIHNYDKNDEQKKPGIYDWQCTLCEQDFESKYKGRTKTVTV
jgi:hypothetical protein